MVDVGYQGVHQIEEEQGRLDVRRNVNESDCDERAEIRDRDDS